MFGGSKQTFGQPASTGFGFGGTTNTATPFGGQPTGFGQTSAFGQPANNSLFGGSAATQGTGLFGASTSTAFGQPQQQQAPQQTGFGGFGAPQAQPQQQTSLFGGTTTQPGNTSLFGGPNTGFGQAAKPTGFGGFGQTAQPNSSLFGQASTSTAGTTGFFGQQAQSGGGMFGATATPAPAFGMTQENAGTAIAKYQLTLDSDTILVKGNQSNVSTKQHCITFMKEYANKSLEELRLEDYMSNRKGPQAGATTGGLFGSPQQTGGMFGSAQPSTGLFGQTSTAPATGGLFGNTTNTIGGFGQTNNAFGATSQQNNSLFNKPFGQTTTTQTGFGGFGTSSAATATPFGQTKPLFGTTGGTTGGGMFGQSNSTFGQPAQVSCFRNNIFWP